MKTFLINKEEIKVEDKDIPILKANAEYILESKKGVLICGSMNCLECIIDRNFICLCSIAVDNYEDKKTMIKDTCREFLKHVENYEKET